MRSRDLNLVVFGRGNVGRALLRQLAAAEWPAGNVTVRVRAVADRGRLCVSSAGFSPSELRSLADGSVPSAVKIIEPAPSWTAAGALAVPESGVPSAAVDLTAATSGSDHSALLERGWSVITANKKPTTGPQADFDRLTGSGRYFREATVGAGLPVISLIRELRETGDKILEIRAAASGTLGFICSSCEAGLGFAAAVSEAKRMGFTEPDPRDDLSGMDVARKALILARSLGSVAELSDIRVDSLIPSGLEAGDPTSFLERLPSASARFDAQFAAAAREGKRLRYLLSANPQGIAVGLSSESPDSPFAALSGPENMFVIRTRRYDTAPLVVRGPGAGAEVTAAGVFGDILRAARES